MLKIITFISKLLDNHLSHNLTVLNFFWLPIRFSANDPPRLLAPFLTTHMIKSPMIRLDKQ